LWVTAAIVLCYGHSSSTKTFFFALMTVDYLYFLISIKFGLQSCNRKVKGKKAFGISMVFSFILEINVVQVIPMKVIQNGNIPQARCMGL